MINQGRANEYLESIRIGLEYYGLNEFYAMHRDVCRYPENPWGYGLECLNDLNFNEFESLCKIYLKG